MWWSILIELHWQTKFWMSCFLQIHGGDVTNEAYLLTLGGTQWTAMASMAEVRRGLACGVVRNWATDKEEVVAAAGYKPWVSRSSNFRYNEWICSQSRGFGFCCRLETVEIYTVAEDVWRQGTDLPHKVGEFARSLPFEDTFIVAGGYDSDTIYKVPTYSPCGSFWKLYSSISVRFGNGGMDSH